MQESDFKRLFEPLSWFFQKRGFSREESEELAQETFLQAFKDRDSFRGASQLDTWVFGIAKNVFRHHCRERTAGKRSAQELIPFPVAEERDWQAVQGAAPLRPASPLQSSINRQAQDHVRAVIDELPDEQRRCLYLRMDGGLRYREIAAVQKIPLNRVRSLLFQARGHLKRRLGGVLMGSET